MSGRKYSRFFLTGLMIVTAFAAVLIGTEVRAQEALTFKIQATTYANGKLWYPHSAAVTVTSGDQAESFAADEYGRIDFTVPVGTTSTWSLSLGMWQINFRAEWQDGTMLLYDVDRNNFAQEYHLQADGSYALEYYNNAIYITNQSNPNAPIMGWITQKAEARLRNMLSLDDVARWWYYEDEDHPGYKVWLDWTVTGQGEFQGTLILYNPDNTQTFYHFVGLYDIVDGNVNIRAFHRKLSGEVDYSVTGTITSPTTATGKITLPEIGELNMVGTGWQVDPRGDGGGSEDHFGGGGTYSRLLGNQQLSAEINAARANGTDYNLNRILPFSSQYTAPASLVVEWVSPGTAKKAGPEELALGGNGTMANGITWQLGLGYYYKVQVLDLSQVLPASFLSGLAPGIHTIKYWIKDANGNLSNPRSETIEII